MSQIVVTRRTGTSLPARRVEGMKFVGGLIKAELQLITNDPPTGTDLETAFSNALKTVIDDHNADFIAEFTDPSGHTGEMIYQGNKLKYRNSSGVYREVKIHVQPDNESSGTQHMNIGAGDDLGDDGYLNSLVLEVGWKSDPAQVTQQERNYFLATVNLRRCK